MKILVSGATGFVGRAVLDSLLKTGASVVAAVRELSGGLPVGVDQVVIGNLEEFADSDFSASGQLSFAKGARALPDLQNALLGVNVIVHTAARAHIMKDQAEDPLAEFRKVNTLATLNFARQAANAGVKRFIFISSVGVNGNSNTRPFLETNKANPIEPYAVSKYEAEQALIALANETALEVVIIRPPLVYGPNAPGNFGSLIRWVDKGIPLPLGAAVDNKRSLVALDNLVSFIIHCIDHPNAANEIFLISDAEDVSTTELIKKTAKALGKRPWLISVPVSVMEFAAKLIGKRDVANRLFGTLQIDSSKARTLLGWKPVITMDAQLQKTAVAYLNEKSV